MKPGGGPSVNGASRSACGPRSAQSARGASWHALCFRSRMSFNSSFLAVLTLLAACQNKDCTALGIVRELAFDAPLPSGMEPSGLTLKVCFGTVCDTSRLVASPSAAAAGLRCQDVDTKTPNFPTSCNFVEAERKLRFTTNTVYGGHVGSDTLVVSAFTSKDPTPVEILRGSVRYTNTTDDAARGACTEAWSGTFTKE
jgi:hypothetical protein